MSRVLKKHGLLLESPVDAPLTKESTEEVRRVLKRKLKEKEHPAVAQFSSTEAKERVREQLAVNPHLLPTAFSHRPGREGCALTAVEAERVLSGKSIKVSGFELSESSYAMCTNCYISKQRPSKLHGYGYSIALFESDTKERLCAFCGKSFKGER